MKHIIIFLLMLSLGLRASAGSGRVYHDSIDSVDNTIVDIPVSITPSTATLTIEARAAFDRGDTKPGHTSPAWGLIFATGSNGAPYSISISPTRQEIDTQYDAATMDVTVTLGDSIILSRQRIPGFSLTKGAFNTLVAHVDIATHSASFFGGARLLAPLAEVEWSGSPSPAITSTTPITVSTIMTEALTDPVSSAMTPWTLDSIAAHLSRSTDPVEGYWTYLDRDNDPRYAIPGGRYTLATVATPGQPGAYDIIFIDGATTSRSQWMPGMLKGRLLPTAFLNHYDLLWTDASFRPLSHDIHASITQGAILTLSFPLYHTTLRFSRTPSLRP